MNKYRITDIDGDYLDVHASDIMAALTYWVYFAKGPEAVKIEKL